MKNNSRGSTLVITLWTLGLLSIFCLNLSYGVRQRLILVKHLEARDNLHFITAAGVQQALFALARKDLGAKFSGLNEFWSNNPGRFAETQVGYGKFSVGYEYLDRARGFRGKRFGLIDEERKLNLNKTDQKTLEGLLEIVGLSEIAAQELAAAIVDWRDKDSGLSIPLGSAEDEYYTHLAAPYQAKDADFQLLEELLLVKGVNQEIFDQLNDFVTVYGSGQVNINTASREVLLALGLHKNLVDKILAFRNGPDATEATGDDNVFVLSSEITAKLASARSLSETEAASLTNLVSVNKLGVDSRNFMITSRGKLKNSARGLEIVCVFELGSSDPAEDQRGQIKYWREKLK
ncbi:general secretion pathway protein GspK [Candidatus Omnitrophota bacterium]